MTDITFALEAKSDQLNAVDIMGYEPIIRVRDVKVTQGDQPVRVYFDGDNNRPWIPSKGMLRLLAGAWGRNSKDWIGKHAKIFFEPSVRYAGKEVGGIRIRSLSDIPQQGLSFVLTINRQQRVQYQVPLLIVESSEYPQDKFDAALPKMLETLRDGKMTLQQIIAHCGKTGTLSSEQIKLLEAGETEINDEKEGEENV